MPTNPLLKGLKSMHPGEHLREDILPALGKSKTEIAALLGVSRQTLYEVLSEKKPITANLALRIAKLVGGSAQIWLSMQQAFDLEETERKIRDDLRKIPHLHAA
jgi:addiction module HigA family antidote